MPRATYANVASTLALVVALGGTAVAAAPLITGKNVKNGSLTGLDVKDRSLTTKDFKGSVRGPVGPAGVTGPAGADAAAPVRTVIAVAGQRTQNVINYALFDLGTFTKQRDSTRVDLRYATDLDPEDGCRVQLRVDGVTSGGLNGSLSSNVSSPGDVRYAGPDPVPAVVHASFTDLAVGQHLVTLAVASGNAATTCRENFSQILREVVVDEVAVP